MLLVPLRNCFRDHSDLLWLDAWKAKILLCGQVKLHDAVSHTTPSSDRCIDCIGAFSIQTFSSSNLWRITYYCIHVFSGLCIQPPTNLAPPLYQISTIASIYKRMHLHRVRSATSHWIDNHRTQDNLHPNFLQKSQNPRLQNIKTWLRSLCETCGNSSALSTW